MSKKLFGYVFVIAVVAAVIGYALLSSSAAVRDTVIIPIVSAAIGSIVLAAFMQSRYTGQLKASSYSDIDRTYYDLLQFTFDHPQMYDEEFTNGKRKSRQARIQYDIYALNYWDMCETVYDRMVLPDLNSMSYGFLNFWNNALQKGQLCPETSKTWVPVMLEAKHLHGSWFTENSDQFKMEFVEYIKGLDYVKLVRSEKDRDSLIGVVNNYTSKGASRTNEGIKRIRSIIEEQHQGAEVMEIRLEVCQDFLLGLAVKRGEGRHIVAIDPAYTNCGYEIEAERAL